MSRNKPIWGCLPFRYKNRFFNHPGEWAKNSPNSYWQIITDALKNRSRYLGKAPINRPVDGVSQAEPQITWIGHASFLIRLGGVNIVTDPIFGNLFPLYPRLSEPGIAPDKLPPINIVLISHNHRDHMDEATLISLKKQHNPLFLVPWGDKAWFDARGFERVVEHMWSDSYFDKDNNVRCTFLPAKHWSQRSLFDRNKSLWGSWMIECNGMSIYFAGDTAFGSHFEEIGKHYKSINMALMPIAPCEPDAHMRKVHVDACQAIEGFILLGATHFIPMHWGTFYFGSDAFKEPLTRLRQWWAQNKSRLLDKHLHILTPGEFRLISFLSEGTVDLVVPGQQPSL